MSLHLELGVSALALLLALVIDHFLGEPATRWHPVVGMGNYLGWAGRRVAPVTATDPDYKRFWLGAMAWLAGALVVVVAAGWVQKGLLLLPDALGIMPGNLLAALLLGLMLKPMLAWAMLKREVLAVEKALNPEHGGSLAAGRERLSWLVSRDVTHLTETQVRESAIETLAENLNDSVVAPIFWFLLLGLPGAALYRFANTADAMWGYPGDYKGRNWQWAGKWAARADDVLSWMPARITALLLALVGRFCTRSFMAQLRVEACRTPSPSSGWPMAAMALALDVRLHKPGVYVLHAAGRDPLPADMQHAVGYAGRVVLALVAMTVVMAAIAFVFIAWDVLP